MTYTKPKKQSPGKTRKVITKPVTEIHFNREPISSLGDRFLRNLDRQII